MIKNKTMKNTLLVIIAFILTSCGNLVQTVSPKILTASEAKLVVHSYISPQDTAIIVKVERSNPVVGIETAIGYVIADAVVTMSDGVGVVTIPFVKTTNEFRISASKLPIVAGKIYTLTIKVSNGQVVTASCKVPEAVKIKEWKLDSLPANGRNGTNKGFDKGARLIWQDPAGAGNFYRVQGAYYLQYQTQSSGQAPTVSYSQSSFSMRESRKATELFSDSKNDGTLFASGIGRFPKPNVGGNATNIQTKIELVLISCDEGYFNYHKSLENYSGNNPFSEPTLVSSNITGGLGCFGAYNQSRLAF
jgi:hypothetical protein